MELVELLDKIDDTAPVDCKTCKHMATHAGCKNPGDSDYCLRDWQKTGKFPFHNWEPGNWQREIQTSENRGDHNIVIGGQGEAEVNVKWSPQKTSKHLHYVAEQCGYCCGNLHKGGVYGLGEWELDIYTTEGHYFLVWDKGRFKAIYDLNKVENGIAACIWPSFHNPGTPEPYEVEA